MAWDPDSISPNQINAYRQAAEQAWGDDTRNEQFIGHPQPSAGQCFVTAQWLVGKLGGYVGTKQGHFFWVSPDKTHIIDLCGDQHPHEPVDPSLEGMQLDEDDEPWELDPHQKTWRPGPAMYKRATHPLWKGFRIIDHYPDHQRAKIFANRADAALRGKTSSLHEADLMGPEGLQTEQQAEDFDMKYKPFPMLHDEPSYDPVTDITTQEYKWVLANGQLHVSPMHSHEEMFDHAGANPASRGPAAVGYVNVSKGHATWEVNSNVSMRGLYDLLSDYSDTVGWKFDGMVGPGGAPIHDDFGPKKSMWYAMRKDGHLVLSESPLPHGNQIRILGKTAYISKLASASLDSLQEWANDFGYKLAEYPGGGDMTDKMKVRPNLDTFNRGDTDFQPERDNPDQELVGDLTCGACGQRFDSLPELRLHHRDHEPHEDEIQDGHFPQIDDFDAPLPFRRRQPSPNQGETIQ